MIAQKFIQVADLLEIDGANPFRVRAYRNAARTIFGLSENLAETIGKHGDLTELPGIGKDLSSKIEEIVETGHLKLLDDIEKKIPKTIRDLLIIPSLGPKRVQLLYRNLNIKSLQDLQKAAETGQLLKLRGFGEKTRSSILEGLKKIQSQKRLKLNDADEIVEMLLQHMKSNPSVLQLAVAGSYRRKQETVGDIDILATAKNNKAVINHFLKLAEISEVVSQGATRSTVILRSGYQIDLRVVAEESYGSALLYFTGSKAHNIALRSLAQKHGLKINEYGVFSGDERVAGDSEENIYRALKLPFIEPELRENSGEIEAALKNNLPELLIQADIMGDLHTHTTATDGFDSIKDMALAAQKMGYAYLAITDHSQGVAVAHGLNKEQLRRQIKEIDLLNRQFDNFTILKSCEVNILEDGSLDLADDILSELDFTVCAVHTYFQLSKEKQTRRIIRAMENPLFKILAHPTGRLIGVRESYELDMEKIISAAARLGRTLEINSQPDRLDLSDRYCKMAKDLKVKMAISTDAHSRMQLNYMRYGVGLARRGWLTKNDIINTLPLKKLKEHFG